MPNADLLAEFERAMYDTIEVSRKHKYNPSYFAQMLGEHGALGTAKRLLASNNYQTGLYELITRGLDAYTVEAYAISEKYHPLFAEEEVAEARRRLTELGSRLVR